MRKMSLTTDYIGSTGDPARPIRLLAEAGFTHTLWCHQWCTDFLYGKAELAYIKSLLKETGVTLLDIHGSQGQEKCWSSPCEYQRRAGVELVVNRIEMMSELEAEEGGDLMMHFPTFRNDQTPEIRRRVSDCLDALMRSLDELMPVLEKHGRRIALENMWSDNWEAFDQVFSRYPADRIGICYDSGHGNGNALKQLDFLEARKERLYALHLNDNAGEGDQHQPPFYGTADWDRIIRIVGTSAYGAKPVSFELVMRNTPFFDAARDEQHLSQTDEAVRAYLADAYERCAKVSDAIADVRSGGN